MRADQQASWLIGAGIVLMILGIGVAIASWPSAKDISRGRTTAVASKPPEPLRPGIRRYTPQPFRLDLPRVEITLLHINVALDAVELTFRVRAGDHDTALLYEPPGSKRERKNIFGTTIDENFEELYIVDDTGGSFYSTTGFVGGRQASFNDYNLIRRIALHPGEAVILSAKFPMINPTASSITFISPQLNGWQQEWRWRVSLR